MNRRQFLVGAGALASGLTPLRVIAEGPEKDLGEIHKSAPPCGLFCPSCDEVALGQCHGCGCDCGRCHGKGSADNCRIAKCAKERRVEHCGRCREFPCTELIGMCYDPVWVSHRSILEQLRNRNRRGTERWITEQRAYWTSDRIRANILVLTECKERKQKLDR